MRPIILASQSPRRSQLLQWAEVPFTVIVSNTDEQFPATLNFEEAAIFIAQQKTLAVIEKYKPATVVLAADTIVVCNNVIIGKPADRAAAIKSLMQLSEVTHKVITGVWMQEKEKSISFAETTLVTFHSLTKEMIEFYVDKYKPYDKAGAYAIQEWIGVTGIKSIAGDFYNVMGLPVSRVVQALAQF